MAGFQSNCDAFDKYLAICELLTSAKFKAIKSEPLAVDKYNLLAE